MPSKEESIIERVPKHVLTEVVTTATSLFIKNGFDRTTTRVLSKALGWSKGRMYQYLRSKDEFIHLLVEFTAARDDEYLENIRKAVAGLPPTEALRVAIRMYLENIDQYQDLYKFLAHIAVNLDKNHRQKIYQGPRRIKDYFEALIVRGVEAGEFQTANTELAAFNILALANWATGRWSLNKRYALEEFTKEQTALILKELGSTNC